MHATPDMELAAPRLAGSGRGPRSWLRQGLETHIALPLFALVLVALTWTVTLHLIETERRAAEASAHESSRELIDTYEAQLARNLNGIDQTLKVMRYAVELKGAQDALPALLEKGLLPPGLVFVVGIADRDGRIVASNPQGALQGDVSGRDYFRFHIDNLTDQPFVSRTVTDQDNAEAHVHFTRRISDASGGFAGVVLLELDPAYFTSGYEHSRLGARGLLGLYGDDQVYRARRTGEQVSWGERAPVAHPASEVARAGVDGEVRFISIRKLHGYPLNAVAGLAEREQLAAFRQLRRNYLYAASGLSAGLAVVVAMVCVWSWQAGRTRRRIRRAQERYAAASEASLDAFFVMRSVKNARGEIVDFILDATNSRADAMTGVDKAQVIGRRLLQLLPEARQNGLFEDLVRAATMGGVHEAERRIEYKELRVTWVHRQVVGVEGGIVCIVRDITERKRTEQRILQMAHFDELTGLPNRSLVSQRLEQAIAHAHASGGAAALGFIDLDGFKLVNDGLGHKAGDELLRIVSSRMQQCLDAEATLARFGGDEFVLLLPRVADTSAAAAVMEAVRQAVAQPVMLGGQAVRVSASMGVVMYPQDGLDANALLMNADAAMYRAKELGSNNVQFYRREMNSSVEQKLVLLDGLRGALEQGQFSLVYQPKVDLRTGRVFGVEALVRWKHPELGNVSPASFIPLAEETGLIVQLGEWVLRAACAQNQAWRAAGLPPVTVSVNVSARQFAEQHLVERVAQALRQGGLPAEGLEIEVTESLIMRDMQQAIARMRELKAMGVSLSVDDFGTGYSSLSALKSFPISTLKIDKSFVSDLATNADDQAIAMAVISLGHKLNLRVIAEGVETEQQYRFLRDNECDEMQGYLFSRPLPPEEIAAMLARSARMEQPGEGWITG